MGGLRGGAQGRVSGGGGHVRQLPPHHPRQHHPLHRHLLQQRVKRAGLVRLD